MTETQKGVLTLIKSAIDESTYPLPEEFSINEAYDFIIKHRVMMLAYDGAVRCGISKNEPAMQKLFKIYVSGMMKSEKQLEKVKEIYAVFDKNGIDYLPLKGCNMKYLYPKPELRAMGDADILIREEQIPFAESVLEKLGYKEVDDMDHHSAWHSDSLHLEIHRRPFSIANTEFFDYFGDGWKFGKNAENHCYKFSAETEFLHLLTHFTVHCRTGGIGIRHVADFYVYKKAVPNLDENYVLQELEKLNLKKLYRNLEKLLDAWFGNGEMDEGAKTLSDFILSGGDWGSYGNAFLSMEARSKKEETEDYSRIKSLFKIIFQPLSLMKVKYTKLQKYPVLLPFYWVKRWFEVLFFRRRNIKRKADMLKNYDSEKIREYKKMLNETGIDCGDK